MQCNNNNNGSNVKFRCYKAGNSGDISYLLSSSKTIHDVITTSWRH